ncbi:serine-rich adhesin for platelets-like [Haliotis asinina]|uniref:serine-rich adhesin for platelets-like n=1 Tax=Haliotis asinina TaxID=109174 RepID=UPI003531E3DD
MDRQEGLPPFDVEETVWCEGCRKLKKEVKRLQEEHAINYQTLKQKIISTDLLIRKYRTKCEEYDVQNKRLEDLSRKLDRSQLDCEMLETQLKASLQSTEPLKQTRVDLEAKLKVKDREILNLKNSLEGAEMMRRQFEALIASNDILSNEEDKKQREKKIQALESSNSRYANQMKSARDDLKSLKSELSRSSKHGRDVEIKLSKSLTKLEKYWKLLKDNDLLPKGERKPNKAKVLDDSLWETSQEEDLEDTGPLGDEVDDHQEGADQSDNNDDDAHGENVEDDDFMDVGGEDVDDDPEDGDYPSIDFPFTFSPICTPVSPLPPSPVPTKQRKASSPATPTTSTVFENEDSMDIMAESLQSQLLKELTASKTKSLRRSPRLNRGKDRTIVSSSDEQAVSVSESLRTNRVKKQKVQDSRAEQPEKGAGKTAIEPSARLQNRLDFSECEGYDLETSLPGISDLSNGELEEGTVYGGNRKGSSPFPVQNLIEDLKRLKEVAQSTMSDDEEQEDSVMLKLRPRNKTVLQQSPLTDRTGTRSPVSSANQSCSTDEKENVTENLQDRPVTPKKVLGTSSKSDERVRCEVNNQTDRVTRSMSQPADEKTKQSRLLAPRPKSAMAKMEDGFLTPTPPKSKKMRPISPKSGAEPSPKKQTRTRTTSLPSDLSDVESFKVRKSPRSRSETLNSTDSLQLKKSLRSRSVESLYVKDADNPVRVLRSRSKDIYSDSPDSKFSRACSPAKQKKDSFVKRKAPKEEKLKTVVDMEVQNSETLNNIGTSDSRGPENTKCATPKLKKGSAKEQTRSGVVLGKKSSITDDMMDIEDTEAMDSGQMDMEEADRAIVKGGSDTAECSETVKAAIATCNTGVISGMDIKIDSSPDSVKASNQALEKKHSSSESDIFSENGHNKDSLDETLKGSVSSAKTVVSSESVSDSSVSVETPVKCSKQKSTPKTMSGDSGSNFKAKAVSLPSKSSKSDFHKQVVSSDSSDSSLEEENQKGRKEGTQKKCPKKRVIDTSSQSGTDEDERANAKDSGGHLASDSSPGLEAESDTDKISPGTKTQEKMAVKAVPTLSSSDSEVEDTKRSEPRPPSRKPRKTLNTRVRGSGKKTSKATRNQQKVFTSKEFISTESDSDESDSLQAKKPDKVLDDIPSVNIASKSFLSEHNMDRMDLVIETMSVTSTKRGQGKSVKNFKDRKSHPSSQQSQNSSSRGTFPSDNVFPGYCSKSRDTSNALSEEDEKNSRAKEGPSSLMPKRQVQLSRHRYQPFETEKDFADIIFERRRITRSLSEKSGSETKHSGDSEPLEVVTKTEAQRKTDLIVEKLKSAHEKKKCLTNLEKDRLNMLKRKSGTDSGSTSEDVKNKGKTTLAGPDMSSVSEMDGACSAGISGSVTDSDMDTIKVVVYQENLQSSASDSVFSSPVKSVKSLDLSLDKDFNASTKSPLKYVSDVTAVESEVDKDKVSVSPKQISAKTIQSRSESVFPESVISNSADVEEKGQDKCAKDNMSESAPQADLIQSKSMKKSVTTQFLPTSSDSSKGHTGSDMDGAVHGPSSINSSFAAEVEATEEENSVNESICGSELPSTEKSETLVTSETLLPPAPESDSTGQEDTQEGERQLSAKTDSNDHCGKYNGHLEMYENVQDKGPAHSSITGQTSPKPEKDEGQCLRSRRLLRADVANKNKTETSNVKSDVSKVMNVTSPNAAKEVPKGVISKAKDMTEDADMEMTTEVKDTSKNNDVSGSVAEEVATGVIRDRDVMTKDTCSTKDKDLISRDKDLIKDNAVISKEKHSAENKDVTSTDRDLTKDKDVTEDVTCKDVGDEVGNNVAEVGTFSFKDRNLTKVKGITAEEGVSNEDKDVTNDKGVIIKDVTVDVAKDKDVTLSEGVISKDSDETSKADVASEDSKRDGDIQGSYRKTRRKLQRVSASDELVPQPEDTTRTTRANQLKRANMKRQMSFDQEEAKTVDDEEPSTAEKKTRKESKELDSSRKELKEEETRTMGKVGIKQVIEARLADESGDILMEASQDEVNAEDLSIVMNKDVEETGKEKLEPGEAPSDIGHNVEEMDQNEESVTLKEMSVVSQENVQEKVDAGDQPEKTQNTDQMSDSEEDSDDGSKRKRVESQNSFGFTVNNSETTNSTEGPGLLDALSLIPELQELDEEDTFAEDVKEPKSIMTGSGSQTPERVASPEIVALTQGSFSSISALLRSEFSLASVSTATPPPSPMNFLRIRDPVSPLPPSPTGLLDDPPIKKGKSKRKTLRKTKNRPETPPTPDGAKFTKIAPLDEAVSSMTSGMHRRVARLARPQSDLPNFGADLSSTTVRPKAVYSKPGTVGQSDAPFFPVVRSAEISLAKQQLAKRQENKEKKEQEKKTRKRKSLESDAAPEKKQIMKTVTQNLSSAPVTRAERELESYLQSTDATPTSFCKSVIEKQFTTDVAMEIFRAVVKTLQTSSRDQLPLVYAACCAGSDVKGPFMTDTETRILELITAVLEKHTECPRYQLMELLWNSIFLPCAALPGRLALCRMFTALCRYEGDLEQVRVFIFKLLTNGCLSYMEPVLAVVGVWPLSLLGGTDPSPMIQVVRHTILEAGAAAEEDRMMKRLILCYQKICHWQPLSQTAADLLTFLVNNLKQSILTNQHRDIIYEAMKSIELFLWKQGWKFVYINFVNRHLTSVTDAWKAKGDNSSVDPRFLKTMLRLFGNVYHLPKFLHKHKDFVKVIKRCFISTLERPTEHIDVQLTAAEVLEELSPFHPQFIMDVLREWFKHNKDKIPAQQQTNLEQTRQTLIATIQSFSVEEFV